MYQASKSGATRRFLYSGSEVIAEYDATNTVQKRYVRGSGADEVLVEYDGSGTTLKTWLIQDERGSIIAGTNSSGVKTFINTYDAYGKPGSGNIGTFQYTGQMWLSEADLYHYKARQYHPGLGRFMQTDPIGYGDGMNMYSYVGGDPMNATDPTGNSRAHPCMTCWKVFPESNSQSSGAGGGGGGGGNKGAGSGFSTGGKRTTTFACVGSECGPFRVRRSGFSPFMFAGFAAQNAGRNPALPAAGKTNGGAGGGRGNNRNGQTPCNRAALAIGNGARFVAFFGQKAGGGIIFIGLAFKSPQIAGGGAALAAASTIVDVAGAATIGYATGDFNGLTQAVADWGSDALSGKFFARFAPGIGQAYELTTGSSALINPPPPPVACPS